MEMGPTSITDITKPYPAKEPVPETTSQEVCHGFKCVNTFVESYKFFKIKLYYLLLIQKWVPLSHIINRNFTLIIRYMQFTITNPDKY